MPARPVFTARVALQLINPGQSQPSLRVVREGDISVNVPSAGGISSHVLRKVSTWRLTGELFKITVLGDPAFIWICKFLVCLSEKKEAFIPKVPITFGLRPAERVRVAKTAAFSPSLHSVYEFTPPSCPSAPPEGPQGAPAFSHSPHQTHSTGRMEAGLVH